MGLGISRRTRVWQAAQQIETNVSRFFKSVADKGPDGTKQVKWYDEGIGTHWYDQFIAGAIGTGLELNINPRLRVSRQKTTKTVIRFMSLVLAAALTRPEVSWACSGTAVWLKPSMSL